MKTSTELRSDILDKSLILESELSDLIAHIIRLPKTNSKTLGNKSSALSFKTKVDLLFDLNRFSKNDYDLFILFMEFRNQFIHNIKADSFINLFAINDNGKKNKLLKVNPESFELHSKMVSYNATDDDFEQLYIFAFAFLFEKLRKTIIENLEQLIKELEEEVELRNSQTKGEMALEMLNIFQDVTEEFGEQYSKHIEKQTGVKNDFAEMLSSFVHQKSIKKFKLKYPELED